MPPLKILSIDGGGSRGIIPATILDCVFNDYGKLPNELFDLFAGTSTGGIICTALAAGIKPSVMVDLYLNKSADIFHHSWLHDIGSVEGYLHARYSNDKLQAILVDMLGTKTLADLYNDPAFGGSGKFLMVCSFDLSPAIVEGRNNNYRPKIFHSSFIGDEGLLLSDLCMRTSAGPTYFPVYQQKYVDGGVALNNPTMAAIAFAINDQLDVDRKSRKPDGLKKGLGYLLGNLHVLSLSTGTGNKNRIETNTVGNGNWGDLKWIKYLPDLITESNMQSTDYYVSQVLPEPNKNYRRIQLVFDAPGAPPILSSQPIGLDAKDPAILQAMHDYAKQTYKANQADIAAFLGL